MTEAADERVRERETERERERERERGSFSEWVAERSPSNLEKGGAGRRAADLENLSLLD